MDSITYAKLQARQGSSFLWHQLVRDRNGDVWAWGNNDEGELGTGDFVSQTTPVPVPSLRYKGIRFVVASGTHSFAIDCAGSCMPGVKTGNMNWAWDQQCLRAPISTCQPWCPTPASS